MTKGGDGAAVEKRDRVERLTNLVAMLLDTRRPLTLDEIAGELGYSEGEVARRAAFERDKKLLRDEGYPIETVQFPEGGAPGYRIDRDRYYLDLDLTDDEVVALNLAMAAVHLEAGWSRDATWKLGGVTAASAPPLAFLPAAPSLPALFDGYRRKAPVTFTHRGQTRNLDPYALLFRNGFWYVVGRDHARDEPRTFRLDRIEGKVKVGEPGAFAVPADFDVARVFPDRAFQVGAGEVVEVDVLVDDPHSAAVVHELGETAVVERREGAVVVRLEVTNLDGFRSWLFGLLDHAEVIGPPDVRADVVAWLEEVADARG